MRLLEFEVSFTERDSVGGEQEKLCRCTIDLDSIVSISETSDKKGCEVNLRYYSYTCEIPYDEMVRRWKGE